MLYYENLFINKVKFKSQSNWIQSDSNSLILKELLRTVQTRYHARRTTNCPRTRVQQDYK